MKSRHRTCHQQICTFAHMKGVCDTPLHLFAQNMDITISKQTTPSSAVHLRSHGGRMRYAPTPVRLIHGYNDLGTNIPINGLTPSRMCRDAPTLNWRIEKRRSTRGRNSAFFNDYSYRFKRGQNDLLFCNLTNLIDYINRQVFLPESEA